MIDPQPIWIEQPEASATLWRYMRFDFFTDLLLGGTLYFPRADRFDDPFEGSVPRLTKFARAAAEGPDADQKRDKFRRRLVKHAAVSCWREDAGESAAMWKLYCPDSKGVAIRTTFGALNSALDESNDWVDVLGRVRYIDFQQRYEDDYDALRPFFWKRQSFEHEKEVRALISKVPSGGFAEIPSPVETKIDEGIRVTVNVATLIERVHVAPACDESYRRTVEAVVRQAGFEFDVVRSEMGGLPVY